jgi:hypothetical protein
MESTQTTIESPITNHATCCCLLLLMMMHWRAAHSCFQHFHDYFARNDFDAGVLVARREDRMDDCHHQLACEILANSKHAWRR